MSSHNNFDGFSDGFSTHSDDGLPGYTVEDGYYDDTYEMPTATLVEEEGVIVPEKLEEDNDLVVVDAEVVKEPWYTKQMFYVGFAILSVIAAVVVVVLFTIDSSNTYERSSSYPTMVPTVSFAPSPKPSLSATYMALVYFYKSASGDNWTFNDNWILSKVSWCDWFGVECDVNNISITKISLGSNNMQGTLFSSIGDIPSLERLELSGNELSGPIPSEVGLLLNLERLDLRSNSFSGSIPSHIGSLPNLKQMFLDYNNLLGTLPVEVCNLVNNGLSITVQGTNIDLSC